MELKTLLRELCEAPGVAGAEDCAAEVGRRWLEPLGACRCTPLGSVLCTVLPPSEGAPHILLDAHIDEIGLIVTEVLEGGFVKIAACGGVDRRVLAGAPVTIHGRGPVAAVVCSTPPHLQDGDGKKLDKLESFTVDCGFDTEEARRRIAPGDRITFDAPFVSLCGSLVSCKALDDRAGCAAVLRAGELLRERGAPCGVTISLSTQEEVGGQGARTAAFGLEPTHAIEVDVSFGGAPGVPKHKTAPLGSGPMIGFAPILCAQMSKELAQCAEKHGIPFTREVMGGRTGTNADDIAAGRAGVRTAMLSIPQRNMHTPAEIVSLEDIEHVAQLIAHYVGVTLSR